MATTATAPISAEEFARMQFPEGEDYELVEGELIPLASGNARHSLIRDDLRSSVWLFLKAQRPTGLVIAETDCRLNPHLVRRPHVSVFLPGRPVPLDQSPIPFPPDIAVEVLSPSEGAIDVAKKRKEYLAAGTREVWVIDGDNREIQIWTLAGNRTIAAAEILTSDLLPGFSLALDELIPAAPATSSES